MTKTMTAAERIQSVTRRIPSGCVASYGQVADLAGLPGRARMVGRALGQDDDPDSLPWYRVLRSDGRLALPPDSDSFRLQRDQLLAEGVLVKAGRVSMRDYRWQPNLAELAFGMEF